MKPSSSHWARDLATALFVVAVGLVLTGLASYDAWSGEQDAQIQELADEGELVSRLLEETVDLAVTQLRSAQAFFEASEAVGPVEFARFALIQGGSPGMVSLGFARVVPTEEWATFTRQARAERPQYVVVDMERRAMSEPPLDRPFVPVWYSHLRGIMPSVLGVDLADDPLRREAIDRALASRKPAITPPVEVLGDPESSYVEIYSPVRGDAGGGPGVVFTSIDIFELLDESTRAAVRATLADIPQGTGDPGPVTASPDRWTDRVEIADRLWEISLTRQERSQPPALVVTWLVTGLAITLLGAILTAVLGASRRRRRELRDLIAITKEKDVFLASVAHELRTPLTSVVGITALLAAEFRSLDTVEIEDLLDATHAEASDLADLIEDLLVAGRLDAGAITYRPEIVDVGAEVRRVVNRVSTDHRVEVGLPATGPLVYADPLRVRQIVRNIVVNAIRYSRTALSIETEEGSGYISLAMRNDGPAIPEHLEEVLFEPYQEGRDRPYTKGSIGLGLPVSRRLAQAMGGDLSYQYVDGWCVFTVRLPAADVADEKQSLSSAVPAR